MKYRVYKILITMFLLSINLNGDVISFSFYKNMFNSSDNNYKEVYGDKNSLSELDITLRVIKNVYVWGSYKFGKFTGETFNLKSPTECSRNFINFGVGLRYKILKPVMLYFECGGTYADFEEDSLGNLNFGNKTGFIVNGGIRIHIYKPLFIKLKCGYVLADTKVNEIDIKLGGLFFGGGIGFSF
jgi:hypothetical protein